MNSPDKDPKSELDYAPPWAREQAAREQTAREQAAREQTARDQFRATLRQSAGAGVEQPARNDSESRSFGDDRPWRQRALEPELVPEPPAGLSNLWLMMLRLGAVCAVAAMVAAAVVFLFNPKQAAHKIAQASVSASAGDSDDAPSSIESSRGVPALAVETSAGVTTPPAQGEVAIATPPRTPQAQLAAATPPQLAEGQTVTAPPAKSETAAEPAAPAQQIASLPAPTVSSANIKLAPAPAANELTPRPVDANPAATDPNPATNPASPPAQAAPGQTAPGQAAPPSVTKPAVVLDENEINTLIRRGKNLLNDGDFAAARVLFERAANAGSAEAALALGSTYDPNVIKRLGAIMVKPDIENARKWYQLAAARGLAAASLQLANLPQSR
jgi:hypothetical protein